MTSHSIRVRISQGAQQGAQDQSSGLRIGTSLYRGQNHPCYCWFLYQTRTIISHYQLQMNLFNLAQPYFTILNLVLSILIPVTGSWLLGYWLIPMLLLVDKSPNQPSTTSSARPSPKLVLKEIFINQRNQPKHQPT